jgi:hypothetical protein
MSVSKSGFGLQKRPPVPIAIPIPNGVAARAPVVLYTDILFDKGERNERYTGFAR